MSIPQQKQYRHYLITKQYYSIFLHISKVGDNKIVLLSLSFNKIVHKFNKKCHVKPNWGRICELPKAKAIFHLILRNGIL